MELALSEELLATLQRRDDDSPIEQIIVKVLEVEALRIRLREASIAFPVEYFERPVTK